MQRQALLAAVGIPATQSASVISEPWGREKIDTGGGGIPRHPGEQFSSTVSRQHQIRIQPVTPRDRQPQSGMAAIGVVADRAEREPPQPRGPGHKRGTGIKQLRGTTAQLRGESHPVSAMTQVDAHPDPR